MALRHASTLIPPSTWQGSWVARTIKGSDSTTGPKWSSTLIPAGTTEDAETGTTMQLGPIPSD